MSIFLSTKQTIDIPLGDDNVVTVKAKLSSADQSQLQNDLFFAKPDADGTARIYPVGQLGQKLALLKRGIKGWRGSMFVDDTGRAVQFKPELLDVLDMTQCEWWVDIVAEKIDELNKPAGGDDPKPAPSTLTA
jgi:hypothetical protein